MDRPDIKRLMKILRKQSRKMGNSVGMFENGSENVLLTAVGELIMPPSSLFVMEPVKLLNPTIENPQLF